MKRFEKVLGYFGKLGYVVGDIINDDVVIFKDVKWDDYYNLEGYGDICCVEVDYNYMNRKKYDVIVVRNKKVFGNKNMDLLFKKEVRRIMEGRGEGKMLLSDIKRLFNNKNEFGLLYNFRSGRWSVNDYSDRFENWCRRSGMLVKEEINVYKRRWMVI